MGSSEVLGDYFKSSSPKGGVTGLTEAQNEPKSFFLGVADHSFAPLLNVSFII